MSKKASYSKPVPVVVYAGDATLIVKVIYLLIKLLALLQLLLELYR